MLFYPFLVSAASAPRCPIEDAHDQNNHRMQITVCLFILCDQRPRMRTVISHLHLHPKVVYLTHLYLSTSISPILPDFDFDSDHNPSMKFVVRFIVRDRTNRIARTEERRRGVPRRPLLSFLVSRAPSASSPIKRSISIFPI